MTITQSWRQKSPSLLIMTALFLSSMVYTTRLAAQAAFKINGKTYTVEDLAKEHQGKFFEIEQKKYELISDLAREKYLEEFFQKLAEKDKVSVDKARDDYLASRTKVPESEIKDTLDKFKDNPQLKERSDAEKKKLVTEYLQRTKTQEVFEAILAEGVAKKQLEIQYPEPKEPTYKVVVTDADPVKYGPNPKDTKPFACKGNDCAITVVEYSEYQCPFCERVQPAVRRLMKEYQGKIRWIVRDFPLAFHNRARPAAVAAHCAKDQGKFWEMYEELFKNQKNLADADLRKAAQAVGLDLKKYDACFANPAKKLEIIEENFRSGEKLGVTGTPAFFINGRRLSGALPYEEFKRVIDSELAKK